MKKNLLFLKMNLEKYPNIPFDEYCNDRKYATFYKRTLIINDDCKAVFLKRVKDYMGVPPYYAVRIIFDDENLNFPWDNGCNSEYKDQLKDIDDESIDYSKFISNDKLNVIFDHKEIDLS